jgi:pilus assembly protein CpaB
MNRVRILMVLVTALLAGGGLAAGTYSYLQNVPTKTVTMPTKPVVVARANLALGSELRADDLVTTQWPESSVPQGAFSDPSQIVGRGLIAAVVQHEPILPAKLASKEAGSGLPPVIPKGKRAVSVKVNEVIGVAGYVLPGTIVDVLVNISPSMRPEDMTSKVVLTQVPVLTSGTRMEQDLKDNKPVQVTVVTLLVTPEQAEKLALASTEGKIHLALRNPLDDGSPATPGVQPAVLLGRVAPRVARGSGRPAAQPAPMLLPQEKTIEIIRGDKRERIVVG